MGAWIIRFLAKKLHLSLLDIGLSNDGYTKSHSLEASGELSFVRDFLKHILEGGFGCAQPPVEIRVNSFSKPAAERSRNMPVIFDVGSNIGDYAKLLRQYHPTAAIHCFEPNPTTFAVLQKNLPAEQNLNNLGLSNAPGELKLFFQKDNSTSVQATLDPEILKNIAGSKDLHAVVVQLKTIDQYCTEKGITHIDFLKIDTEGFELEALQGATELLHAKKIRCIQFEFNEVNIVKRRFIKDFYDLLTDFEFYRLDENRMIPMGAWHANHEVFRFQNIVAVRKNG